MCDVVARSIRSFDMDDRVMWHSDSVLSIDGRPMLVVDPKDQQVEGETVASVDRDRY